MARGVLDQRGLRVAGSRAPHHQGHAFPDGPPPTRLRYCINSVSREFVKDGTQLHDALRRGDNNYKR